MRTEGEHPAQRLRDQPDSRGHPPSHPERSRDRHTRRSRDRVHRQRATPSRFASAVDVPELSTPTHPQVTHGQGKRLSAQERVRSESQTFLSHSGSQTLPGDALTARGRTADRVAKSKQDCRQTAPRAPAGGGWPLGPTGTPTGGTLLGGPRHSREAASQHWSRPSCGLSRPLCHPLPVLVAYSEPRAQGSSPAHPTTSSEAALPWASSCPDHIRTQRSLRRGPWKLALVEGTGFHSRVRVAHGNKGAGLLAGRKPRGTSQGVPSEREPFGDVAVGLLPTA